MSDAKRPIPPYQRLGAYLRSIRQKASESLPEVSGAVEIDPEALEKMEQGYELPNEDILMLLINHFGVHDDEAVKLWQLAGYDEADIVNPTAKNSQTPKQAMLMVLAMSDHIVYTDGVNLEASDTGVVINFTQRTKDQTVPVSRVGMSYVQAEKVLLELSRAMLYQKYASGPKALPRNTDSKPE